jgi:hypothetical protein
MFTNQRPLAAATRNSIRLRIRPDGRSVGGFSCANINSPSMHDMHYELALRYLCRAR